MTLDLTAEESAALAALLRRMIADDRYPLSPRVPRARERGRYPHDFVSVSDHLGSIRRVGLQNN